MRELPFPRNFAKADVLKKEKDGMRTIAPEKSIRNEPASPELEEVAKRYAVSVTDEVLETIDWENGLDPVARQYLPSAEELKTTPEELADPIGDDRRSPVKGIVHRYPDRVLLKPVHVCAVYCRFCFRREKVGPGSEVLTQEEFKHAFAYIRNTPQIWEVIITGGDPFILSPRRLREIVRELENIAHVKVIRFHSRVPVANPSRVTEDLVQALKCEKAVYVVLHSNHPRELTDKVEKAARMFVNAGIPLLSQSTLLRGVNDDAMVLETLFRRLVELRIKPYYLHHPDRASGTSHFRLPVEEGQAIVKNIWGRLSGIAQPLYVLDIPGGFGKIPAGPQRLRKDGEKYTATDYMDNEHTYEDK